VVLAAFLAAENIATKEFCFSHKIAMYLTRKERFRGRGGGGREGGEEEEEDTGGV
jgi:hypothetical protein